jgi:hypothetical protein
MASTSRIGCCALAMETPRSGWRTTKACTIGVIRRSNRTAARPDAWLRSTSRMPWKTKSTAASTDKATSVGTLWLLSTRS